MRTGWLAQVNVRGVRGAGTGSTEQVRGQALTVSAEVGVLLEGG